MRAGATADPATRTITARLVTPVANLAIRAMGLAMRLALLVYLARYLGIDAVGKFGLIQGAAGVTPVALGWGASYFLGREIVGRPPVEAGRRVRDRLVLTGLSLAAAGIACAALIGAGIVTPPASLLLVAPILVLEAFAFDIHVALISVGKPLAANWLLFIRTGAWVVPAAGLGILLPELRTLDFVLACWLAALFANFAGLAIVLRAWPLAAIGRASIDKDRLRRRLREGWLIYLNDLALVGMVYLDRYIVDWFLDLRAVGVFVLHWSIANALHVLVSAAIVQVSLPDLVQARRDGGTEAWRRALAHMIARVAVAAIALGTLLLVATAFALPRLLGAGAPVDARLLGWMLLAMAIRLVADAVNYGLYSLGLDRPLALINLGAALASAVLGVLLVHAFGLTGTALAMIATASLLLVCRSLALGRWKNVAIAEQPA
ncbi:hypothetical protein K32_00590 [Kaistia sp. 32K]|uniref:lipopolysaccharide biosynthesis protein n=1 Tax=Kaistia sp. 32K TaxID=2795690 RepID=UPI00191682E7|nr:hypothetical protein [Kaistia sp. 32K]BCP51442.1 hypothetical protein K32_00590 [Kaistia sp. 32K]